MSKLSLDGVTKRYGSKVAVDNISFEAQAGRVLGLLGPNGAGKTTLFNTMAGLMQPDEGEVVLSRYWLI